MNPPVLGPGSTYDHGRYAMDRWLRGHKMRGIYAGHRTPDGLAVLITVRSHSWSPELVSGLRFETPGVAPLLFCGPPDGYDEPGPAYPERMRAIVEERPQGDTIADLSEPLSPSDMVRVALGLIDVTTAARARSIHLQGIRPETVYVVPSGDGYMLGGIAPRAVSVLGYQHDPPYKLFDGHSYDAPELLATGVSAETSALFSVALTIWASFTKSHPYRVSPYDIDEGVMAADDRDAFPGPKELAQILEPILVADVSRRPSVADVERQLRNLARTWNVQT